MEIVVNEKQISTEERAQVSQQVKAELIEHLYQGCLPGTICGIPVGIAIFVDFYKHTPTYPLIAWFVVYNLGLLALTTLFFAYTRYKNKISLDSWLSAYSINMSICATLWGVCVFLIPEQNLLRQYFAFIALFLLTPGYATGTIGQFRLCVFTLSLIIVPLIVWNFMKGTFFYNLVGCFSVIYLIFLCGINRRSTQWFIDSLKLKLENTLVSYQANHDLLTDLPNQRLLPQYIESAISSVKNFGGTFAVVCFSLNRMEIINDSLGLQAGDLIIQSVASRLNEFIAQLTKSKDQKTRYIVTMSRKDIFNIVIFPLNIEKEEDKIKSFFSVLDEPFYLEKRGVKLTASIGVSFYPKDGENVQALLGNADSAMLKAKQAGGNRIEFYRKEINSQLPKQLQLEIDLHAALKNKEFEVYYQPLIDVNQNQIAGMEALIRWKHPRQGFISPIHFIPLAEETGLIVPIGEWILREACAQTRIWHQMGFPFLKVAVNLAEKQLRQDHFLWIIDHILETTGLNPRFLELEITETAILDEAITALLKEFKKRGLSLSVDDFGTGYSGLSYLKRFAIDKLKIDQSFIRDIPASSDSITIVSAIIAMAKELRVKILAEGVETEEQLTFLRKKGCNYIQGYYFSKPVDVKAFTQLLLKSRDTVSHPIEK
ncbi:MAG: cph2 6 [Gammaproteobacteria bacterium]|jgi:diguanylate cyclase (GGDEF)-like protein|nr:cph2 6 [Gammaproteobacteria bacterium]